MNDPLQLPLRDIHMPDGISWWPPTIGWWVLISIIILAVILVMKLYKNRQARKYSAVNMAKQELLILRETYANHKDGQQLVIGLSVLLRRLSISIFNREDTASLTGDAWLQYLNNPLEGNPFSSDIGRLLCEAPYRKDIDLDEMDPLFKLCEDWVSVVAAESGERA